MRAALNRRVVVVGYSVATSLGDSLTTTWQRAARGESGFQRVTRCDVQGPGNVVGEIPDWRPEALDFVSEKDAKFWNAQFVHLAMLLSRDALTHAGLEMTDDVAPHTASLIGSALNGVDAFRVAMQNLAEHGPNRVSPFLLPNLCANLPSGKAGVLLGHTGPIFSPQGACASGNHAIGIGARMIRDGDVDFALCGGVEMPLVPEILHGFSNMNALFKCKEGDRAFVDPNQASRPFSVDRKGFVLAEGGAVLVLAAVDAAKAHGLQPLAEVAGVGWTSDAFHFTSPHPPAIVRSMKMAIEDAELTPIDIEYVNAHGTSTRKGDRVEVDCLREVFGKHLSKLPISSNKSMIGHLLGGAAAAEAVLTIEGMQRKLLLPTANHVPDPELADVDVVPNSARKHGVELAMNNAFGFGGTNCCIIFRGMN